MQMPCETLDGPCMVCKIVPPNHQVLICDGCGSGWHMQCLVPPLSSAPDGEWKCVDCEPGTVTLADPPSGVAENGIVNQVRAIHADSSLSEEEKARRIMNLHCPTALQMPRDTALSGQGSDGRGRRSEVRTKKTAAMDQLNENLKCMICLNLVDRPVTTPCGHNSCLKCFQKVVSGGNHKCPHCRALIPPSMRNNPRVNSALVMAIRLAALAANSSSTSSVKAPAGPPKAYHHIENEKRPDRCFTSERAVKTGKANAASGKIFVTVPPDHFGPITAANDPERGQGVLVGESWADRMDCRQWGAHLPHVAGIAGQSSIGAQSVCLSGGYEDDEDHGEWFLYTGSGGRDLSGNKRTNKAQSFDQVFEKSNEALRVSCRKGYPVRVVRSHKEKRSSYAPETACVRYDGIYRIEMCWRKEGIQGFKVCRYLFVRCDNEPAPWLSDEHGDRPRKLPNIPELEGAVDITKRRTQPAWDWKEEELLWGWTIDPPGSRMNTSTKRPSRTFTGCNVVASAAPKKNHSKSIQRKLLRGASTCDPYIPVLFHEFGCVLCHKVMQQPLSTPCAHNFCKSCLLAKFAASGDMRERKAVGGRSLRTQKVNGQLEDVIASLQRSLDEEAEEEGEEGEEEEAATDSDHPRKRLKSEAESLNADEVVKSVDEETIAPNAVLFEPPAVSKPDGMQLDRLVVTAPLKNLSDQMSARASRQPSNNGCSNRPVEASTIDSVAGTKESCVSVSGEEHTQLSNQLGSVLEVEGGKRNRLTSTPTKKNVQASDGRSSAECAKSSCSLEEARSVQEESPLKEVSNSQDMDKRALPGRPGKIRVTIEKIVKEGKLSPLRSGVRRRNMVRKCNVKHPEDESPEEGDGGKGKADSKKRGSKVVDSSRRQGECVVISLSDSEDDSDDAQQKSDQKSRDISQLHTETDTLKTSWR
ncbi:hypothetical protein AXG93_891s1130 [Marchantia polymorpha subsp. ruderalis]|uniref:RING-type E3 ubiquitin transferase n=1 Tax=Marchantia polymorpha subsp. ruderalis TaxID=1480154 RepID=A0A176VN26_MARPO|nr:hypothetical protein AXG93_891s1130 [Marchantia polymorpha subsp. ruderalis]